MVQVKISTVHFVCLLFFNRLWTDTRDLLDWVNHFQMNLRYTKVCVRVCVGGGGGGGAGYHFILLNFVKNKLAKMVRRSDFHCSFSLLVLTVIRFLFAD